MYLFAAFTGTILFMVPLLLILCDKFLGLKISGYVDTPIYSGLSICIISLSVLIKAVNAFPEIRNRESASAWLLLPASPFEKFLSKYLSYSLGAGIFTSLTCFIFSSLSMLLNIYYYSAPIPAKLLNDLRVGPFIWGLLIFQTFFFIGGLYFKKNPFIKTMLTVILFYVISYGILSYIFSGHIFLVFTKNYFQDDDFCMKYLRSSVVYLFALPVIYFRVKEFEIDEV